MSNTRVKGTTVNSLGYTGIVTLSQYIRGKKRIVAKIHNRGNKPLFDFFADCLVGNFDTAKLYRPNKIMLLYKDDENVLHKAEDTDFIYLLSNPEKVYNDTEGVVRYSFIIPQDRFAGKNFNAIGLYTKAADGIDVNNYAAYCDIKQDTIRDVSLSSVLVLDWELHISNIPDISNR